jgi:hypothetical protein
VEDAPGWTRWCSVQRGYDMLWNGGYPRWLRAHRRPVQPPRQPRSERLLGAIDARLKHVIGAHLSQQNNRPGSRAALARGMRSWVSLATGEGLRLAQYLESDRGAGHRG